jgi:hypothetical protein
MGGLDLLDITTFRGVMMVASTLLEWNEQLQQVVLPTAYPLN